MIDTPSGLGARLRLAEKAIDAARELQAVVAWHLNGEASIDEVDDADKKFTTAATAFDREAKRDD